MPNGSGDRENAARARASDDAREETDRFSQDDDDLAGRSWPGMTSEIDLEDLARFEEDDDEDEPESPPGQTDRV